MNNECYVVRENGPDSISIVLAADLNVMATTYT